MKLNLFDNFIFRCLYSYPYQQYKYPAPGINMNDCKKLILFGFVKNVRFYVDCKGNSIIEYDKTMRGIWYHFRLKNKPII